MVGLIGMNVKNYGEYTNQNYGTHTLVFTLGQLQFYFSYETIIAVYDGNNLYVTDEKFSQTTEKHKNLIGPDKERRFSKEDFTKKLVSIRIKHNLF